MLHRRVQHPEIPPCTQFQFQPMVTPASERARVRRPARSNARDLSDAAEWRQLDSPVKDLRAFGLEQELAFPQTRAGADVHNLSVDEVGDIAAVTDHLDASPLSSGAFDIALPPKTFHILPLWIASVPVEPALPAGDRHRPGMIPVFLATLLALHRQQRFNGLSRGILALEHQEVAAATLDDLAFHGGHPESGVVSVGSVAMQEDAGIHGFVKPPTPGLGAPFELNQQPVVLIFRARDETAELLAGNADRGRAVLLHYAEDVTRVLKFVCFQVRVEVAEVFAIEEANGRSIGLCVRGASGIRGSAAGQAGSQCRHHCDERISFHIQGA